MADEPMEDDVDPSDERGRTDEPDSDSGARRKPYEEVLEDLEEEDRFQAIDN